MTTTNVQSTHTKNELLRGLVIAIGCLAMLLSGVGALYWMQARPDEASAGVGVAAAGKPANAKPLETPRPTLTVPTPHGGGGHADVYFDFRSGERRVREEGRSRWSADH